MVMAMNKATPMVPFHGDRDRSERAISRLQLLKWTLLALAALSLLIAFLFAAFIIGLLLTLPLVVLGIFWLITMAWRSKIRIRRDFQ
jgi:Flp pilus assembly protein TadB